MNVVKGIAKDSARNSRILEIIYVYKDFAEMHFLGLVTLTFERKPKLIELNRRCNAWHPKAPGPIASFPGYVHSAPARPVTSEY